MVLLHTYALVWNGLFNCKPFEAVIRYGVPALERGDQASLARLLAICLRVDVATSIGATLAACLLAGAAGGWLGWTADLVHLAQFYGLVLLTGVTGTAKGVLRLYNRFDILARQLTIGPLLRLAGVTLAWLANGGVALFALAWGVAFSLEQAYTMQRGWREWQHHTGVQSPSSVRSGGWREEFPGLARFLGVVYCQSNLDLAPKHLSTLLVGAVLGPAEAGLFRLAREFSSVLATPALLLRQVLFPDFARLWHYGGEGMRWLLARTLAGAAAGGVLIVVVGVAAGGPLLELVAGPEYRAAAAVLGWLLVAASLDLGASVLRAASYAMGQAGAVLRLNMIALAAYIAAFLPLTHTMGLTGPGAAACISSALVMTGMLWMPGRWKLPVTTGVAR